MFLITNGDLNDLTDAIVVSDRDQLQHAVRDFVRATGTPIEQVTIQAVDTKIVSVPDISDLTDDEALDPNWDEEPSDGFTDAEADADTLASAGWGTDEDYGFFGGGEDYF